jgi:hypothetical protein
MGNGDGRKVLDEVVGGKVLDGNGWREGAGWKWLEGRYWMEVVGEKVVDGSGSREGCGWKLMEGRCLMEVVGGKVLDGSGWREGVGWKWLEGRCWMEVQLEEKCWKEGNSIKVLEKISMPGRC